MSLHRTLLTVQGYIELDMPVDALRELDALPEDVKAREEAMEMRLFVLMRARWWDDALAICRQLMQKSPSASTGYIHGAFCLHELGKTQEARMLLLEGPATLRDEPTYHYNLGCYEAVLGHTENAVQHLETSFEMDRKFCEIARHDPDLKNVLTLLEL